MALEKIILDGFDFDVILKNLIQRSANLRTIIKEEFSKGNSTYASSLIKEQAEINNTIGNLRKAREIQK